jgi:glycosyltransferase involved in cell wall biosynthesis
MPSGHPRHVCWLNHRMREYYDLWERFLPTLKPLARTKERVRRLVIRAMDHYLLTRNVTRLFVISRTVQKRLQRWGKIASSVLYPPPPVRMYRCDSYGDFIFAFSRLTSLKRMDLLLAALACPDSEGIRCVIAGEGEESAVLGSLISRHGLEGRVSLPGHVDDRQLVDYLARCRAVCFPPYQEDYGFVTVEAFASRKPVITCTDSGGPAELVEDGCSGFVCPPRPEALALAMRRLVDDERLAERLGGAGYRQ